MSDKKITPNSFMTPNEYVDTAMELLSGEEVKCLQFATRHILGWQDKLNSRRARISLSTFEHGWLSENGIYFGGTGLSRPTVVKVTDELNRFKVLLKIGEPTLEGQEFELGESPDWEGLRQRKAEKTARGQRQTATARTTLKARRTGQSDKPALVNGINQQVVNQTNQQVVNATNQEQLVPLTSAGLLDKPIQIQVKDTLKDISKDIAPVGASDATDVVVSSTPSALTKQPTSMPPDGYVWIPGDTVLDDDPPERYPCTAADVNAMIGAWWEWVPLRPTKRGKVIPAAQHFANATNREFAQNLTERGVNPSDFIDCLGDIRVDPNSQHAHLLTREMNFCYAAEVVESWVRDVRSLDTFTADCPRVLPRKPGLVIELGELAGLTAADLWARYADHPDVIVDVPPAYLSPHALIEDNVIASVPLDRQRLAEIAQEFPL